MEELTKFDRAMLNAAQSDVVHHLCAENDRLRAENEYWVTCCNHLAVQLDVERLEWIPRHAGHSNHVCNCDGSTGLESFPIVMLSLLLKGASRPKAEHAPIFPRREGA